MTKKQKKTQIILTQKDYETLLGILWAEVLNVQKYRAGQKKISSYEKTLSRIIEALQTAKEYEKNLNEPMKKQKKIEHKKAKIIYDKCSYTTPIIEMALEYIPFRLREKIEIIGVKKTKATQNVKLWDILD